MLDVNYEFENAYYWLFFNLDINLLKKLTAYRLGYSEPVIDKIYISLFPDNNTSYYIQKSNTKNWSENFKKEYARMKNFEIDNKFAKLFFDEILMSKNPKPLKPRIKETHTATDFSNFVFCPAYYYLNQIFQIDLSEHENVFIGSQEHYKNRLISVRSFVSNQKVELMKNDCYSHLARIKNANCLFLGHSQNFQEPFYSKLKKISGIPDYIFEDQRGSFVVEEKYTFNEYNKITNLFDNHKIQALTYLYGLDQFNFEDAYIVYWYIEKNTGEEEDEIYKVNNYRVFHLKKTNESRIGLINIYNQLELIQNRISYKFDVSKINYNKCVKCNYFSLCKFKNGTVNQFVLPNTN